MFWVGVLLMYVLEWVVLDCVEDPILSISKHYTIKAFCL